MNYTAKTIDNDLKPMPYTPQGWDGNIVCDNKKENPKK